jgi:predicted nucleic acid-binding Zn ribbon protein|tara:strand:- start:964 stop:1227 length:264 start_codon:yes stop_codon:yes gene_type:complete
MKIETENNRARELFEFRINVRREIMLQGNTMDIAERIIASHWREVCDGKRAEHSSRQVAEDLLEDRRRLKTKKKTARQIKPHHHHEK